LEAAQLAGNAIDDGRASALLAKLAAFSRGNAGGSGAVAGAGEAAS
jgi:hypothetical protein